MLHTEKALRPVFWHLEPSMIKKMHCEEHIERRRRASIKDGTTH
jgi:hypothetical protein